MPNKMDLEIIICILTPMHIISRAYNRLHGMVKEKCGIENIFFTIGG